MKQIRPWSTARVLLLTLSLRPPFNICTSLTPSGSKQWCGRKAVARNNAQRGLRLNCAPRSTLLPRDFFFTREGQKSGVQNLISSRHSETYFPVCMPDPPDVHFRLEPHKGEGYGTLPPLGSRGLCINHPWSRSGRAWTRSRRLLPGRRRARPTTSPNCPGPFFHGTRKPPKYKSLPKYKPSLKGIV